MPKPPNARRVPPLSDDLIAEILPRLPAKSVGRFRCVSKRWLALSSDPQFIQTHYSFTSSSVSGFFLFSIGHRVEHLPFHAHRPSALLPDPSLSFLNPDGHPIMFDASCNGLVLCHRLPRKKREVERSLLYVCNPMTKEYVVVTGPEMGIGLCCFSLAFDPATAPHFKIVGIQIKRKYLNYDIKDNYMHIYSSKTLSWKLLINKLPEEFELDTFRSCFCNGTLFWVGCRRLLVSMDVEAEEVRFLPSLPAEGKCLYYGESGGHLHVIWSSDSLRDSLITQFEILEMEPDCSGWSVLHHVNMNAIKDAYPKPIPRFDFDLHGLTPQQKMRTSRWKVCFFRGGNGGGDQLLFSIFGKIVSYHLQNKNFKRVCINGSTQPTEIYCWYQLYPHIHTLCSLKKNQKTAIFEKKKIPVAKDNWVPWTREHDKVLISLMVEHTLNGQRRGFSFLKNAWRDIMRRFNADTGLNYDIDFLKGCLSYYRQEYQIVEKIRCHTGFTWDNRRHMLIAGDVEWKQYI